MKQSSGAHAASSADAPLLRMPGLPRAEGDGYLDAAIAGGRRPPERDHRRGPRALAQACTIRAERQLLLGRLVGVRAALAEAAPALGR